jgi:large subunit ribosomal protein L10
MALTKKEKQDAIKSLNDVLSKAKTVVFAKFDKVTVAEIEGLRKDFRGRGIGYRVAKKTLAKLALDQEKIEGSMPELPGQMALVYGVDVLEPARGTYEYQKKLENKLSILGGVFEGKYVDAAFMTSIATIPSLKTLQAQFVNIINSPLQGFAVALNEIAKKKA